MAELDVNTLRLIPRIWIPEDPGRAVGLFMPGPERVPYLTLSADEAELMGTMLLTAAQQAKFVQVTRGLLE